MRLLTTCLLSALFCADLAFGTSRAPALPDPSWSKPASDFSAFLMLSDAPDEVLDGWATRTAELPTRTARRIGRGRPIVAFVFFTGCEPDRRGLCNAAADFTILSPDGSVYESFSNLDLWRGKPAPPAGTLRLSAEYVGVVIEPDDPLGRYEFHISLHDRNSGTTLELMQAFTATAE